MRPTGILKASPSPSTAGGDGDSFIQESKSGGAQAMLTIPMIGWVAKLGAGREPGSYNTDKYGPQTATDPYGRPRATAFHRHRHEYHQQ